MQKIIRLSAARFSKARGFKPRRNRDSQSTVIPGGVSCSALSSAKRNPGTCFRIGKETAGSSTAQNNSLRASFCSPRNGSTFEYKRKLRREGERGQAAVFLVLCLGFFLIGGIGLAVDGGNMFLHRQAAQTAADAACTAGAIDMLSIAAGADLPNTAPTSSATSYAQLNGYSSGVFFLHPDTLTTLDSKPCDYTNTNSVCDPHENNLAFAPYLQVNVTDRVPTTFMRFVGANPTVNVVVPSTCGLSNVLSPVPVLVLNPNEPIGIDINNVPVTNTLKNLGTFSVSGAPKSVQVNSTSDQAVDIAGSITLDEAVGDGGGALAVAGRQSAEPLSSGKWVKAAGVMSDPFAMIKVEQPAAAPTPQYGITGCPGIPPGVHCDFYQRGYYPPLSTLGKSCPGSLGNDAAICVGRHLVDPNQTGLAVFEPGVYYLAEDFFAADPSSALTPNAYSCLRSATTGGDNTGGTMFYLANQAVLNVTAGSGALTESDPTSGATIFNCASPNPNWALSVNSVTCSGANPNLSGGVTTLAGNVLLGPCGGVFGDRTDADARGILFFHDRDVQPAQPRWLESGPFALVGDIYFHYCNSISSPGTGSGANCDPTAAFTETLTIGGGGPNAYIVGGIVVDQLQINSGAQINVALNPNRRYYVLKASLLQ